MAALLAQCGAVTAVERRTMSGATHAELGSAGHSPKDDSFVFVESPAPEPSAPAPQPAYGVRSEDSLSGVYVLTDEVFNGAPVWAAARNRLYASAPLCNLLWTFSNSAEDMPLNGGIVYSPSAASDKPPGSLTDWRGRSDGSWVPSGTTVTPLAECPVCSGRKVQRMRCGKCKGKGTYRFVLVTRQCSCDAGFRPIPCSRCEASGWIEVFESPYVPPPPAPPAVHGIGWDPVVRGVVGCGFPEAEARQARQRCSSREACVAWILEHRAPAANDRERECCTCCTPVPERQAVLTCSVEQHWTCRDCLRDYLSLLIKEHRVTDEDLVCPGSCGNPIDEVVHVVAGTVSEEQNAQFLERRLQREYAGKGDMVVSCPSCSFMVECGTERDKWSVECKRSGCRVEKFCGLCGLTPPHMPEMTCTQFAASRETLDDDTLKSMGIARCPRCRMGVQRSGSCKYMVCDKSAGGCGETFCILCGKKTTRGHLDDGHACVRQGYDFQPEGGGDESPGTGILDVVQMLVQAVEDRGSRTRRSNDGGGEEGGGGFFEIARALRAAFVDDGTTDTTAEQWTCSACTLHNPPHRSSCAVCSADRPAPSAPTPAPAPPAPVPPPPRSHRRRGYSSGGSSWDCRACTFTNPVFARQCEVCGGPHS